MENQAKDVIIEQEKNKNERMRIMKILVKGGQSEVNYHCSGYGTSGCKEKSVK